MSKVKLNQATGTINRNTDHRDARDRFAMPDRMHVESVVEGSTVARFNDSRLRQGAAPNELDYVAFMQNGINTYLNSEDWREAAEEAISCEFRPTGTEPTVQQVALLESRDIEFDPRTSLYDRSQVVTKGKAIAGDFLFSEPCSTAALFSTRLTVLDANVIAGFTANGAEQTIVKLLTDFQIQCNTTVAKILAKTANLRKVKATMPKGAPREVAEDLIDILAVNVDTAFGSGLDDFTYMLPISMGPTLDRAAQRAGVEDVSELIGAGIQYHSGPKGLIFMVPNAFAMLSFREQRDGDIWSTHVTRNPAIQGFDIEISGVADVVANAMVRLKIANPADPKEKLQTETVKYPVVTLIELETK